ncbi:MAG: hypothetical protein ACJASB_002077 [Shewanella psychromarinicola]|jgi:hypothetical protein
MSPINNAHQVLSKAGASLRIAHIIAKSLRTFIAVRLHKWAIVALPMLI